MYHVYKTLTGYIWAERIQSPITHVRNIEDNFVSNYIVQNIHESMTGACVHILFISKKLTNISGACW